MTSVFVDLVASMSHYESHLRPIWDALPDFVKGDIRLGEDAALTPPRNHVCLVASWRDMNPLRGLTKFIYVEHGSGQSYGGGDGKGAHWPDYSASGGERHMDVLGYICPSQRVADLWRGRTAVVGSPRLDEMLRWGGKPMSRTVCFSFHWPCKVAPESDTAYFHYAPRLPAIVAEFTNQGWQSMFQVHPKWEGQLDDLLANIGMTKLGSTDPLLSEIMVCDNSSIAYEAAALGRVGLSLNAPGYRRGVHHGLRFWDAPPGLMVDEPEELLNWDLDALASSFPAKAVAEHAAHTAYGFLDGNSAERAATAILSWLP